MLNGVATRVAPVERQRFVHFPCSVIITALEPFCPRTLVLIQHILAAIHQTQNNHV
jgi:hypothetical protein